MSETKATNDGSATAELDTTIKSVVTAIELGGRNSTVLALREGFYRNCEARANGFSGDNAHKEHFKAIVAGLGAAAAAEKVKAETEKAKADAAKAKSDAEKAAAEAARLKAATVNCNAIHGLCLKPPVPGTPLSPAEVKACDDAQKKCLLDANGTKNGGGSSP